MDYDVVNGFGPEITTIRKLTTGDYYFYVHDFTNRTSSGSTALARSGATVTVYYGTSNRTVRLNLDSPNEAYFEADGSSTGVYWSVFKLTVEPDSRRATIYERISITPINTYGNSIPAA